MPRVRLHPGEQAPWFRCRNAANPRFAFDSIAGHCVVLSFLGSAQDEACQRFLAGLDRLGHLLNDDFACFFGVSIDRQDEIEGRIFDRPLGIRFFHDDDHAVSRLYGALNDDAEGPWTFERRTFILDQRLRVVQVLEFDSDPENHLKRIVEALEAIPALSPMQPANLQAPVLVVPRVFEPEFCQQLIAYYNSRGGRESGFMRDMDGKTVEVMDYDHKRRRDEEIDDEALRRACMFRIHDRLVPELRRAFQFAATRIERYVVACYEAETAGHFRPHRDNTTLGTAHRRFAVSLMLNTGEYEGGLLRFPEYGSYLYSAPAGGAVVFSCSLLHEATPVTSGKRYVFLPFLYDEAAVRIREQNRHSLEK
jgi:peroxiredoxin/predicted 2-oxoglutarate/Fe(II)-dependent dioxygenase YbiX